DTNCNPTVYGDIATIAVSGPDLYAGRLFRTLPGEPQNGIARLSADGIGRVDTNWNPNPNGSVRSLVVLETNVFALGRFTVIGGASRSGLAKLSTAGTGIADPDWNPNPKPLGNLGALAVGDTNLYVAGA